MTTNFRRDRNSGRRKRFIILSVSVLLLLTLLSVDPVERVLSSVALRIASPFWGIARGVGSATGDLTAYFSSKASLKKENDRLRQALYANTNESYRMELLARENVELRSALGRAGDERRLALATVLVRPPTTAFDTLVIDLGSDDGVVSGLRVYSDGAFAIGEVVEVFARTSLVSLFSSSGYEIDGFLGASSTPVTFKGIGGGAFRASVPRGADIRTGDPVVLPSLHGDLAGVVSGVDFVEGSSLSTVHMLLPADLRHLRFVYVDITPS